VSHLVPLAQGGAGAGAILADVLEFRRIYGREVARLAAERADESDLEKLRALADGADGAKDDAEECLRIDFEFYVALTHAAKNRVMGLLINTVRQAVMNYASFFVHFNVSTEAVRRHHRALLRALAQHNVDAAVKIADAYLAGGAEHLLALAGAHAAPPGNGSADHGHG
jgi:DNA-binding FadR family transcriptional regulator